MWALEQDAGGDTLRFSGPVVVWASEQDAGGSQAKLAIGLIQLLAPVLLQPSCPLRRARLCNPSLSKLD
eukprot:1157661-Pelagomonas_calceolata.AAC.12